MEDTVGSKDEKKVKTKTNSNEALSTFIYIFPKSMCFTY